MKATIPLKNGFRMRIGYGENTNLWSDLWVGNSPFIDQVVNASTHLVNLDMQGGDIINEGRWNTNNINHLPKESLENIKGIPLPYFSRYEDALNWGLDPSRIHSTHSSYTFLGNCYEDILDLWRLGVELGNFTALRTLDSLYSLYFMRRS